MNSLRLSGGDCLLRDGAQTERRGGPTKGTVTPCDSYVVDFKLFMSPPPLLWREKTPLTRPHAFPPRQTRNGNPPLRFSRTRASLCIQKRTYRHKFTKCFPHLQELRGRSGKERLPERKRGQGHRRDGRFAQAPDYSAFPSEPSTLMILCV